MKLIKAGLVGVGLLLSGYAQADCLSAGSCVGVNITRMYVTPAGDTRVSTSGQESNLPCNAGTAGYLLLSQGQKNYNATYSLLLSAFTTESPVWIRTTTSADTCRIVYVVHDKGYNMSTAEPGYQEQ